MSGVGFIQSNLSPTRKKPAFLVPTSEYPRPPQKELMTREVCTFSHSISFIRNLAQGLFGVEHNFDPAIVVATQRGGVAVKDIVITAAR